MLKKTYFTLNKHISTNHDISHHQKNDFNLTIYLMHYLLPYDTCTVLFFRERQMRIFLTMFTGTSLGSRALLQKIHGQAVEGT